MTIAVHRAAIVALACGCALLTLRPVLLDTVGADRAVPLLVALFAMLLVAGAFWRGSLVTTTSHARQNAAVVFALGVGAFAMGRVLGGGEAPQAFVARFVVLNTLAAVAEEAFFRRLAYSALAPGGAALQVVGSASLFALVHVTVYGWWVLPIDLAAGLLLSWQRWATGGWAVPAATHVVANLLVVL